MTRIVVDVTYSDTVIVSTAEVDASLEVVMASVLGIISVDANFVTGIVGVIT